MRAFSANLLGLIGICLWAVLPVFVLLCGDTPLAILVGGSCITNFFVLVTEWKLTRQSFKENLTIELLPLSIVLCVMLLVRFLYWGSLQQIHPVETILIHHLWPAFIIIGGAIILNSIISWKHLAGLFITLTSLVILLIDQSSLLGSLSWWHVGTFMSAVVWAAYVLFSHHSNLFRGIESALAGGILGVALLTYSYFSYESLLLDPVSFLCIVAIGVCNRLGHLFWTRGATEGSEIFAATSSFLMIALSILAIWMFGLAELDMSIVLVTLLIVCAGISMSEISDQNIIELDDEPTRN